MEDRLLSPAFPGWAFQQDHRHAQLSARKAGRGWEGLLHGKENFSGVLGAGPLLIPELCALLEE